MRVPSIANLRMRLPNKKFTIYCQGADETWTQTEFAALLFPNATAKKKPDHNCLKSVAHGRFEATTTLQVIEMLINDPSEIYYGHNFLAQDVDFNSIETLAEANQEYLECVEVVQAPQKRGKKSPALNELNKSLRENADLIVITMDVLEVQDLAGNTRMKKRLSKLKERNLLIVIVDAGIMYESIEDIQEVVQRAEQTLESWCEEGNRPWHVHAYMNHQNLVKGVETLFWGKV